MIEKDKKLIFWILVTLFCVNIFAWSVVYDLNKPQFLEVSFFDVGQGDAIFIETPNNYQILIDGGPTSAVLEKLGKEMPFWDRTIDLIVLTHPEHDHIAGLLEVLKRYKVDFILWSGVLKDTGEYKEWKKLIEDEDVKTKIAKIGQKILTPKIFFDVLHPFEDLEGKEVKNTNNTSIALRLVFNNNSFIFTGDLYKSIEKKLVDRGLYLNSDILKVGHHGSKTSTSEKFLEEVNPEIAVISVGKENSYGHPHPEVLDILDKYDIKVLRTDRDGDIKIFSDGENLKILNPKYYGISSF
ncbi:MAG: MBL fold metallo-hydrolase [Candidatus Nealsonbacteria bacterium]|nr:MAG: MBL fold metallo-hydrolase [Candidatus Nealsonbacteria bacterium]